MKRKIFKALAAVAALAFSSCSMFDSIEQREENPNPNTTYIKINLENSSRTALPVVTEPAEFTSFTLTGTTQTANALSVPETTWTGDAAESAYAKMTAASIAVTAGAAYTFTLKAAKGGAAWQGSCTKTIVTGENSLSFTLSIASLATTGKGSLTITLTVPSVVEAVEATLKTMDEAQAVTPTDDPLTFADGKAAYTASGIASGNYVLIYTLYGDTAKTLKLGEWREYAGITDGLTSSSNPVIASNDDLANIYTIMLEANGGTLTGTAPGSYTRISDEITLPTATGISKTNYVFEGWYDAQTGGTKVETIPSGSTGTKKLYARWTPDSNLAAANEVTEKISTIGTVADTAESRTKINDARTAYNALTDTQKALVTNYDTLTTAESQIPGSVGDVLLNDGTIVHYVENWTFTAEQKSKAVGVMYAVNESGAPVGWLGIHNSAGGTNSGKYMWASENTTGWTTKFTGIICTPSTAGTRAASTATFTDDTDGSDNWAYICSLDPAGSANADENYPAFNYVNKYATTFNLTGDYAAGWYMPSIAELTYICRNKTVLNSVLRALGGTQMASDYFSECYCSSSQDNDDNGSAWVLDFLTDGLFCNKDVDCCVCCVRAFSNVAVTGLSLDKTTAQTVTVGSSTSFTATVAPDNATDKTVKWSVSGTGITLYCDSACTTPITTGTATSILTVYAKGTAAGNATVTVTSNADSTKTASCDVTAAYIAGAVLLNDGTIVPYDENRTFTEEQKSKAVGVLYTDASGAAAGWLGLHNSADGTNSGYKSWAKYNTTGYNTEFTDIICTPSQSGSEAAGTATFTGDTDGSNNWACICARDPTGSANTAENYPAFDYVNKYATTFNLTGDYATGWYMPSIAELIYIYRNKTTLNAVLEALGGTQMKSDYYWSSSQLSANYGLAWYLFFSDGYLYDNHKDTSGRVCCVRAFSN